jgi:DtxR family Mn-dependent transcriptional regulator
MENYKEEILEAVWSAEEQGEQTLEKVQTLCPKVELKPEFIESLRESGLLRTEEGQLLFTHKGRDIARKVVRRHRLTECLMGYVLNLDPETMERVACETEHSLLPEVESSICILLGHPEYAPDGTKVPAGDCCTNGSRRIEKTIVCISECEPGERIKIAYIRSKSHELLQQLAAFGIMPGLRVRLLQKRPAYCLQFENSEIAIDKEIAHDLFVWKVE